MLNKKLSEVGKGCRSQGGKNSIQLSAEFDTSHIQGLAS